VKTERREEIALAIMADQARFVFEIFEQDSSIDDKPTYIAGAFDADDLVGLVPGINIEDIVKIGEFFGSEKDVEKWKIMAKAMERDGKPRLAYVALVWFEKFYFLHKAKHYTFGEVGRPDFITKMRAEADRCGVDQASFLRFYHYYMCNHLARLMLS